jgi:ribonuclease HII
MAAAKAIKTASAAYETELHAQGFTYVAGVDEAGRGPLAGPVVAAAVIFMPGVTVEGVYDSKKLSPTRREVLSYQIKATALAYGFGIVEAAEIDRINILQATKQAMAEAVSAVQAHLSAPIGYVLVDGNQLPRLPCPARYIVKGDSLCHAIAAAGILAKVERDGIMARLDKLYPQYGFAAHAGYGTKAHLAAIQEHGPCAVHRRTFKGVKPSS